MIRYVILNLEMDNGTGPYFWSGKRAVWVSEISKATRYKKVEEADKVAFGLMSKNIAKFLGKYSVEKASNYEGGGLPWRVFNPGDLCPDCRKSAPLRDVYTCNQTCYGKKPRYHRHATCGGCGFMALLMPIHSVLGFKK